MDSWNRSSAGRLTAGVALGTLTTRIMDFVYSELSQWRDDPNRLVTAGENELNLQLTKYLDSRARTDFPMVRFNHEEYQPMRRSVDLSASPVTDTVIEATFYTKYDPIALFECKRLPAPDKSREKEYVTGGKGRLTGGIQRFKMGLHGGGFKNAVMIGYIQELTIDAWMVSINNWITDLAEGIETDDCVWESSETLSLANHHITDRKGLLSSLHKRSKEQPIMLHHIWVEMSNRMGQS